MESMRLGIVSTIVHRPYFNLFAKAGDQPESPNSPSLFRSRTYGVRSGKLFCKLKHHMPGTDQTAILDESQGRSTPRSFISRLENHDRESLSSKTKIFPIMPIY